MTPDTNDYENQEFVEQAREQAVEQKKEKRQEAIEGAAVKDWLEGKLEDKASPFPIYDREFYFKPVSNERVEQILELASNEAADLDRDVDDVTEVDEDDLGDMPKFVRAMRETLEEHCMDDYMAAEGLKQIPVEDLQEVFEEVAMGQGVSQEQEERVERFR